MKDSTLALDKTTKCALIADELKNDISSGLLQPNDRLPSFAEMSERFNVAKNTIERVHLILEQEGLIRREKGKGIFVQLSSGNNKTGWIGYVDPYPHYSSHSPYALQLQRGMRQVARESNKHLVMIDSLQGLTRWDDLEGLLLCDLEKFNRQQLRKLFPSKLPVVSVLNNDPVFPSVQADERGGVRLLMEHLFEIGHRRIAYLGFHNNDVLGMRYQTYREALLRQGIEPEEDWEFIPDLSYKGSYCKAGYYTMQRLVANGFEATACTAILAQNDQTAFGAIKALNEAGIRVPEDCSVTGFDGVPNAVLDGANDEYWTPLQLTTIKVPLFEIASTALQLVLGTADQMPEIGRSQKLPVELQVGQSTCAPR